MPGDDIGELVLPIAAAATDAGHHAEARRIRDLVGHAVEAVVEVLSQVQRTPGLEPSLWNAIALFKGHLDGHTSRTGVVEQCLRLQGLL